MRQRHLDLRAGSIMTIALLCAESCAHTTPLRGPGPELIAHLAAGECEAAAESLGRQEHGPAAATRAKQLMALPLSYVASGLGYATDVVLFVAGGVVVGGVICSPIIAVEAATGSGGSASGQCVSEVMADVYGNADLPGIGKGIYGATERWRCIDLSPMTQELRMLATCYADRDGPGDRDKAYAQLIMLRESPDIYRCVSDAERAAIDFALEQLQKSRDRREALGEVREDREEHREELSPTSL